MPEAAHNDGLKDPTWCMDFMRLCPADRLAPSGWRLAASPERAMLASDRSPGEPRRHAGAAAHEGALRQAASPTSRLPVYQLLLVWSVAAAEYCPSQAPRSCRASLLAARSCCTCQPTQGRFAPRLAHATSPLFVAPTLSVWSVRAARLRHAQSVGGLVSAAGGRRIMVVCSRYGHTLRFYIRPHLRSCRQSLR